MFVLFRVNLRYTCTVLYYETLTSTQRLIWRRSLVVVLCEMRWEDAWFNVVVVAVCLSVLLAVARPTTVHARLPLGVSVTTTLSHCHTVTPASLPRPHLPPHATFIAFLPLYQLRTLLPHRLHSDHFIWVINSSLSSIYYLPRCRFLFWQANRYSRVYDDRASSLITLWLSH